MGVFNRKGQANNKDNNAKRDKASSKGKQVKHNRPNDTDTASLFRPDQIEPDSNRLLDIDYKIKALVFYSSWGSPSSFSSSHPDAPQVLQRWKVARELMLPEPERKLVWKNKEFVWVLPPLPEPDKAGRWQINAGKGGEGSRRAGPTKSYPELNLPYILSPYGEHASELERWMTFKLYQANNMQASFYSFPEHHAPKKVLDVGCGFGHWIQTALRRWPEAQFVGLDCRENGGVDLLSDQNDAKVRFVQHNLLGRALIPLERGQFDFVRVANMSLAIPTGEWLKLLKELSILLREGGILEIIDDCQTAPPLSSGDVQGQLCLELERAFEVRGIRLDSQWLSITNSMFSLSDMLSVHDDLIQCPIKATRCTDDSLAVFASPAYPGAAPRILQEGPPIVAKDGLRWHHTLLLAKDTLEAELEKSQTDNKEGFDAFERSPHCHPYVGSTFYIGQYQRRAQPIP